MSVVRDKLGEFVLFAEEFNRFETFAASADNYATVDEAHPDDAGHRAIDLYREEGNPSSDERRVLIHADHVYGRRRRAGFFFNLQHEPESWRDWLYDHDAGMRAAGDEDYTFQLYASLSVRAVTSDFDPAEITWSSAYAGGEPLTFSATALTQVLGMRFFTLHVEAPIPPNDPTTALPFRVWTGPGQQEAIPNVAFGGSGVDWHELDAVYGFEVAVTLAGCWWSNYSMGVHPIDSHWLRYQGTPGVAVCYALR